MKTKLTVMLCLAAMLVASQAAWAQRGQWNELQGLGKEGMGMRMMVCGQALPFPTHLLPMMTVALELNADQIEKISSLEQDLRNTYRQQRDLKADQRALMIPTAQGEIFNAKALRQDLAALMKQKVDLLVKRAELRNELAQVLTAEQREKCQAIMKSMVPLGPRRGMPSADNVPRRGFAERR